METSQIKLMNSLSFLVACIAITCFSIASSITSLVITDSTDYSTFIIQYLTVIIALSMFIGSAILIPSLTMVSGRVGTEGIYGLFSEKGFTIIISVIIATVGTVIFTAMSDLIATVIVRSLSLSVGVSAYFGSLIGITFVNYILAITRKKPETKEK